MLHRCAPYGAGLANQSLIKIMLRLLRSSVGGLNCVHLVGSQLAKLQLHSTSLYWALDESRSRGAFVVPCSTCLERKLKPTAPLRVPLMVTVGSSSKLCHVSPGLPLTSARLPFSQHGGRANRDASTNGLSPHHEASRPVGSVEELDRLNLQEFRIYVYVLVK